MDDFKAEKWTLDDGRRAERRVKDTVNPTGEAERVVELHVEAERPLKLQQRVVERRKPIVYERETHTIDQDGNVVEKKVESVDSKVPMQLVEHIACDNGIQALDTPATSDCDCHVTKDEMIDTIVSAVKSLKDDLGGIKTGSIADIIGKRVEGQVSMQDKVLWGVIAVLVAGIGYVAFFM
jgi:hypothetical protein